MKDELIRVGVIGVGYWGPNLVRTLSEMDGVEVARAADLRPGRREFIARRFPQVTTTAEINDVLHDESISAVFIATPPATHRDVAIAALDAGKHVFIEKPLATVVHEAEEIVASAKAKHLKVAVGHLFLYHPAVIKIRELLTTGELGDFFFLASTRCNPGPPQTKVDVLWDLAPHDVAIALHLVGETPVEVTARGARFTNAQFTETAYVNLGFPSGRMAQINVSWLTPNKTRNLQLVCSKKTVVYDDMEMVEKVRVFDAGQDNRVNSKESASGPLSYGPGSIVAPAIASTEPLRLECEDFVRSIRDNSEPVSNGQCGLEVVRVLDAASRSLYGRAAYVTGARP
jgi:predicted dehydrogenase